MSYVLFLYWALIQYRIYSLCNIVPVLNGCLFTGVEREVSDAILIGLCTPFLHTSGLSVIMFILHHLCAKFGK